MKKLLITLCLVPGLAFAIPCEDIAEAAKMAMTHVQIGTPFMEAYNSATGVPAVQNMLIDAYKEKPGKTPSESQKAISYFSNKYALKCVELKRDE